ncbi:MAG: carbon-nitrogen hydrolase family protein [Polyangiales bacterium]|nr:carbon-nitrogen hydrolase family protein [Myxococcales bacterium]MCB9657927.1 carbon-nitrogen hydrolase family protein [Sandaracinaceae bacterium]
MTTPETPRPSRVGVVQINSRDDVDANLDAVTRTVTEASQQGAELILVPECFAYLGPELGKLEVAEELGGDGPIFTRCAALARELGRHVVYGGFWEKGRTPSHVFNTCVHIGPDGSVRAAYRKVHLFDVDLEDGTRVMESDTIEAGDELVVTDAPFGKLGLSICYDLRFPELYRELVDLGAVALAVPAAFTLTTGKDHWHVLLRARAIEQQCYVLAAAQTGTHFGRRASYGHAMVIDPWGTVLAQCGEGEGAAVATIRPELVTSIRTQLPSLRHRRPEVTRRERARPT